MEFWSNLLVFDLVVGRVQVVVEDGLLAQIIEAVQLVEDVHAEEIAGSVVEFDRRLLHLVDFFLRYFEPSYCKVPTQAVISCGDDLRITYGKWHYTYNLASCLYLPRPHRQWRGQRL